MPAKGEDAETPADRVGAIRAFYESHPYPAPVATLDKRLDRYRDPHRRRAQNLLLWPLEEARSDRAILVAGCGTSQAARHALRFPRASEPSPPELPPREGGFDRPSDSDYPTQPRSVLINFSGARMRNASRNAGRVVREMSAP